MRLALCLLMTALVLFPAAARAEGVEALGERLRGEALTPDDPGGRFEAVVTPAIGANVRRGPWGDKLGALPKGTRVTVTGRSGEFYAVDHGGRTAYIHVNCLAPVGAGPSTPPPVATATGDEERRPPSPVAPPVVTLPPGRSAADLFTGDRNPGDGTGRDATGVEDPGFAEVPGLPEPGAPAPTRVAGRGLSGLPARAAGAESGRAFMARTAAMSRAAREREIERAILAGNVPAALRDFREVRVTMRLADGREHTAVYRVSPDYLAVGDGADAVRVPMSPETAQRIADATGCVLPTATMVDQIYAAADVKLRPRPMSDGSYANWERRMMTNEFYAEHDRLVDAQLGAREGLVAGHKKDVVVSNRLDANPGRVAIYGWHQPNGRPIQGLSTVHEASYADYSHGVRLVDGTMTVDGVQMRTADVMRDPTLSRLVSNEGPIRDPRAAR